MQRAEVVMLNKGRCMKSVVEWTMANLVTFIAVAPLALRK